MNKKIQKIKSHIKNNRKVYIAAGIGILVGVAGTLALNRVYFSEIVMTRIWSPGDNNIMKIFINPLGDPGNVVQCIETGTVYASQGQAARELGLDPSTISRHLNGEFPDVKGNHLVVLGKAGQAIAE